MNTVVRASHDATRVEELEARNAALETQVRELSGQLEWFRRQLFGRKSERRIIEADPHQPLLAGLGESGEASAPVATETVSYERRKGNKRRDEECVTEQGLRFDESVPVETIELTVPEANAQGYAIIGEITHRLAQRPGSYVVLRYVRPVVKRKADGAMLSVPAPDALWEGSVADVSVVAGVLTDKFCFHLPLYRQHQRLTMCGIKVARSTLTTWVHRACALLAPSTRRSFATSCSPRPLPWTRPPSGRGRQRTRAR